MDRITEKVNHASYGYAGFYDIVKIKEDNLDRMITFDNQLLDEVNALTASIEDLKTQLIEQQLLKPQRQNPSHHRQV